MKNLMTFLILTFLTHSFAALSATLKISPSTTSGAQCPLASIRYFVTVPQGSLPICTYTWTVSGGSFYQNDNEGTEVFVIWSDLPGLGTLTVTASGCRVSGENGSTITNTYTRLSVFGQNFLAPPYLHQLPGFAFM